MTEVWLSLAGVALGGIIASLTAYFSTRANNRHATKLERDRYERDSVRSRNQALRMAAGEFIQVALFVDARPQILTNYGQAELGADLGKALAERSSSDDPENEATHARFREAVTRASDKLGKEITIWDARGDKRRDLLASYTRLAIIPPSVAVLGAAGDLLSVCLKMIGQTASADEAAEQWKAHSAAWAKLLTELSKIDDTAEIAAPTFSGRSD